MSEIKGKLIIVCAPSGSGKTTIVKAVLPEITSLEFSVSACSRTPRQGETDGKDYYFLSEEEFRKKIDQGAFLEWEEVYPGSFYGTLKSEVQRIWNNGRHVIFDVDVIGGLNIKKQYPDNSLALFIMPPSVEELRARLTGRGTETPQSIEKRIDKAEFEMGFAPEFDATVVNDDLEMAIALTKEIMNSFLYPA
ncbi:MAG: guanylate kinase [Bacteroidetes bacterium]|nr:MAG: guanylate kinase [Bacteroidota bacterium]